MSPLLLLLLEGWPAPPEQVTDDRVAVVEVDDRVAVVDVDDRTLIVPAEEALPC